MPQSEQSIWQTHLYTECITQIELHVFGTIESGCLVHAPIGIIQCSNKCTLHCMCVPQSKCSKPWHKVAYPLNGELHCSNSSIGNRHQDLLEVVDLCFWNGDGDAVPEDEAKERWYIMVGYQHWDASKPQGIHDPRTPCLVTTRT